MMFQYDVLTEISGQRLEDISIDVRVLLNNAGVRNSVYDSTETVLTCVTKGK